MRWPSRTVLWILLWLGLVLWLLAGITFPAYGSMQTSALAVRTMALLKDIQIGIKQFQIEYKAFPVPQGRPVTEDFAAELSGPLLDCMLGKNVWGNVRGIAFIESPMARNGKHGLVKLPEGYRLVDVWGHSMQVIVDLNGDGEIANPDVKNTDPAVRAEAQASLKGSVIAFSAGPDGSFLTGDDFCSWRPHPRIKPLLADLLLRPELILVVVSLTLIAYSLVGLIVTRARTG